MRIEGLAWLEYNLLGLTVPTEEPEIALDAIDAAIASGQLQSYQPFFTMWCEGKVIKARRDTRE